MAESETRPQTCDQESTLNTARPRGAAFVITLLLALFGSGCERGPGVTQSSSTTPALVGELLPTGARITPTAAVGAVFQKLNPNLSKLPDFTVGQAVELATSPDGRTLLALTSGYNRVYGAGGKYVTDLSNEYVFVFDVSGREPVKRQVIPVPSTYAGIVWRPDSSGFFVAGGVDDRVYAFRREGAVFIADGAPLVLGHAAGNGISVKPLVAGLAMSPNGRRLLAANLQNDSVSLIDLERHAVVAEQDLRPGKIDATKAGVPGGEYPFGVVWPSQGRAFVSSQRDREILMLGIDGDQVRVVKRIKVDGQPAKMILDHDHTRLFAALDNSDTVVVLDAEGGDVIEEFPVAAPAGLLPNPTGLRGASPNNLALSPDERTLFVTNGGLNALAVVQLGERIFKDGDAAASKDDDDAAGQPAASRVIGLIPTGWYPTAVAVGPGGRMLFVVNGKSNAGPNPNGCRDNASSAESAVFACEANNEYVWQLSKAGFLSLPMPKPAALAQLTLQVAANDNFPGVSSRRGDERVMGFLRAHIKHIVYIVKENRGYDQLFGDLAAGNGDPALVLFPRPLTPNHHRLAEQFATLDNFFDSAETSNTGWLWSTAARTTDYTEKAGPVNYARRGLQYDQEGDNRNVNVGLATLAERRAANPATPTDPDVVPGTSDVAAPDPAATSGGAAGTGYLWDAALRAGLTIRNYGFYGDLSRYFVKDQTVIPLARDPFAEKLQVFYETKPSLAPYTDIYYRGFDMAFPDFYLMREWWREFGEQVAKGAMPNLTLLRVPHDHLGDFGRAIDGVDTPEPQMADNDYAVGKIVETIAASPFAADTLIFIVEDDAQNAADHVDAHRSIALVVGPYLKKHILVSKPYTTVHLLRTMEEVLGLAPLGLNDGLAEPMTELFDPSEPSWSFRAEVPAILRRTKLPLDAQTSQVAARDGCFTAPRRAAAYWERAMAGQDFREEDRLDTDKFNAALWTGLNGDSAQPPDMRSRADYRQERAQLLAAWRQSQGCTE
jgi:DNA-binding beta-propeller fold protein YncE